MTRPLRILLFSTLFPSTARPGHGIFVETRLRHLLASGEVEARVVAPVPWFPWTHPRFGDWARMAQTPRREVRGEITVLYPRYPLPPKVGMNTAPFLLAASALASLRRVQREFDFDLIDAHYYYPDGVAAALLAGWLDKPCVVTARGSDLNLLPNFPIPRRWIRWTAGRVDASVGVSRALTEILRGLGADPQRLRVLRNGVDLERFRPLGRPAARAALGLGPGPWLLMVGSLVELKGQDIAIQALTELPETRLAIVGEGPRHGHLESLARRLGVSERVRLVGPVAQTDLPTWYSAANALVLCSSREGWPNVLLESMACGTPVLATALDGVREVVAPGRSGLLCEERSPAALARAARDLLASPPDPAQVRAYAEGFSWDATTAGQLALFREVLAGRR